ncbi:uncharacterized protein LOC132278021 [Cornus florida]|uniref:uncharacterized protein LOC132278021 n=1 Tax=Cornus florida TaxID=4283 RepID=UPI00289B7871|nr:uncharacterized protein LOC132278021 [Cornus florida]
MEQYFECMEIEDDEEKVQTGTMYLTDTAALWWRHHFTGRGAKAVDTWEEFKRQFYPECVDDLTMINLRHLKQKGNIREYVKEYSNLMLEIPEMLERQHVCLFIDRLQSWVAIELRRREPRDLASTMAIVEYLKDFRRDDKRAMSPRRDHGKGWGDRGSKKGGSPKSSNDEHSDKERRPRHDKSKDHGKRSKASGK